MDLLRLRWHSLLLLPTSVLSLSYKPPRIEISLIDALALNVWKTALRGLYSEGNS